jgi:hypothetical protein
MNIDKISTEAVSLIKIAVTAVVDIVASAAIVLSRAEAVISVASTSAAIVTLWP